LRAQQAATSAKPPSASAMAPKVSLTTTSTGSGSCTRARSARIGRARSANPEALKTSAATSIMSELSTA